MSQPKGIENPGSICYLLATLQQLYMIPSSRECILLADDIFSSIFRDLNNIEIEDDTDSFMEENVIENYLHGISQLTGFEIDIEKQRDACDLFRHLLSYLTSKYPTDLKAVFSGELLHHIFVEESKDTHSIQRQEIFTILSLDVGNDLQNLFMSLEKYISDEMIQFSWQNSSSSSSVLPTIKRTRITLLPSCLIIHLKRFTFNAKKGSIKKCNARFEFPIYLDMSPYIDDATCNRYMLGGIIVHNGSASTGHYYSIVRNRYFESNQSTDSEWYIVDDERVTPFSLETLDSETFGSDEDGRKGKNAMILVYDRVTDK